MPPGRPLCALTSYPDSWGMSRDAPGVTWVKRDLQQRQLQVVPALQDGEDTPYTGTAELPADLIEEDGDWEVRPASAPPAGSYQVSVLLQSNHIGAVEPDAFGSLPWLCSLDLSLNHLETLALAPGSASRLCTLNLRNNRLASVAPLGKLSSLRHLDVSLNQLRSLDGLEGLEQLSALAASGNLIGVLPAALPRRLRLLDLQHNALRSLGPALRELLGLSTLRLSRNVRGTTRAWVVATHPPAVAAPG